MTGPTVWGGPQSGAAVPYQRGRRVRPRARRAHTASSEDFHHPPSPGPAAPHLAAPHPPQAQIPARPRARGPEVGGRAAPLPGGSGDAGGGGGLGRATGRARARPALASPGASRLGRGWPGTCRPPAGLGGLPPRRAGRASQAQGQRRVKERSLPPSLPPPGSSPPPPESPLNDVATRQLEKKKSLIIETGSGSRNKPGRSAGRVNNRGASAEPAPRGTGEGRPRGAGKAQEIRGIAFWREKTKTKKTPII